MVSKRGCIGWFKKRTNLEKILLSLSSLFLTLLLILIIVVSLQGKKTEDALDEDKVCWNAECIKTAGDLLSIMHPSKDSCTNFYDFACGRYGQEPGQTTSVPRRTTESVYFTLKQVMESEDKLDISGLYDARKFYNSCVEFGSYRQDVEETRVSLLNLMKDMGIGVWPTIDPFYDTSKFTLEKTLAALILLDVPVVFRMEILPDDGSYLIKIAPGGPQETGRSPIDIRSDVHLRSSVLTSLLLLGASQPITDAEDILSIDSKIAEIEQNKTLPCDDVTMLTEEAVSKLNNLVPEIDWNIIFSEIRNAAGLRRSFKVKLLCKEKISQYVKYLHHEISSDRSETNYFGWRFLPKFVEHVIPTFDKSQFGTDEATPRWRVCLELMEKFASPVLADVLMQKMVSKEVQNEVEKISNSAMAAAIRLVSQATWLNDSERSRILEKVAKVRVRYPFQRTDEKEMAVPVNIPKVDVTNFTAVVISSQRERMLQKFKQLSQGAETFDVTTQSWRPVLSVRDELPSNSSVLVYFDKIRSPYIRLSGPSWLNYGGFGVAVAREISKVLMYMNVGRNEDNETVLWNVWSRSKDSSLCEYFAAQLSTDKQGLQTNVIERVLKEIFMDLSSLEIAYETAKELESTSKSLPGLDVRNERLFFLSYAQTMCDPESSSQQFKYIPVKDRLNAAVKSFEPFDKVFGCEHPPRCQIWT